VSWTLSSDTFEATNSGIQIGDSKVAAELVERVISAATKLSVKNIISPECGHAYTAILPSPGVWAVSWSARVVPYRCGSASGSQGVHLADIAGPCDPDDPLADTVGKTAGFSLHAGVAAKARERDKLERLCRYIALHGCRVLRRLGTIASAQDRPYPRNACR